MRPKRLFIILMITAGLLLIPFIAMQFTSEVRWKFLDFVVAGLLLLSTGLLLEIVFRKIKSKKRRIAVAIAILIVLLLIWAELAVGIFGTPFAGS